MPAQRNTMTERIIAERNAGQIAADIGYQSEAALSRAFVRRFGIRPGAVRADSALRR
jgi:AraC-like DNA-binding protein